MTDAREYLQLAKAIEEAPIIPPCMTTDPEIWYPEGGGHIYTPRQAKEFCRVCPVRKECLAYALATNEQYGIWGGLTLVERRRLQDRGRDRRAGRPSQSRRPDSPQEHPEQPLSLT